MKVTRYGRFSKAISSTSEEPLLVEDPQDGEYIAEAQLDITGLAGIDRGSMLEVSLKENELRGLLSKMEARRAKAELTGRHELQQRCERAEERLDLIWELLRSRGPQDHEVSYRPLKRQELAVLKLVKSLAVSGADAKKARRMVKATK